MSKKITYYIILLLVLLLPWHAFLVTYLSSLLFNSDSDFLPKSSLILASWKEILIFFLGIIFVKKWILEKKFPIKKFYIFDKIFLLFFSVAILSWIFFTKNIYEGVLGFRLDFVYFVLFYIIRGISIEDNKIIKIFYTFCISSFMCLVFGLGLYSFSFNYTPSLIDYSSQKYINLNNEKKDFLKKYYNNQGVLIYHNKELDDFFIHHEQINFRNENYLNVMKIFGYSQNISSYNPNKPLAAYHFVEARGTARFSGTFSGPNQIGFFLILLISMIFAYFLEYLKKINIKRLFDINFFLFLLLIISLIGLFFSFSRSSWIGFIASTGIFTLISIPHRYRIKILLFGITGFICVSSLIYFVGQDFLKRTIIREGSSSVHLEKSISAIKQIKDNPLGLGLGKAGPVTIRFSEWNKQNISENWFLQMFQEFGIIGGILYLVFIFNFLIFLHKKRKENFYILGGFLGLLGILFAGLFLHSFEDMPTSLLVFLFLGIGINKLQTI